MNIKFIIHKALTTHPHSFMRKVYCVLIRQAKHSIKKRKDHLLSTFNLSKQIRVVKSYIGIQDIGGERDKNLIGVSELYLMHRFDLLGSGWVKHCYDSIALGVEGHRYYQNQKFDIDVLISKSNVKYAKEIFTLVDQEYEPIDWQKDFKSGYRWSAKEWYLEQRNSLVGVDIKVPWEIGRLQHLPQLALAAAISDDKDRYVKEFKNQMLDFMALNPPRFGVQWTCTMDVGIRAANMLMAYDFFAQMDSGDILDELFKEMFSHCVYEHGAHIVNNLEYGENLTSNHYLSNIAGLLFVAAYLERSDETDRWLGFAVQEIISEMRKQFYADGSNFEASTSYHRLSSELMLYATALILGLDQEKCHALQNYTVTPWNVKPRLQCYDSQEYKIVDDRVELPQWFTARLYKAGRFTHDITKPNGEIVQFGDNDSGRFFRLSPNGEWLSNQEAKQKYKNLVNYPQSDELYWDENILNHQTLLSGMNGLFDEEIFENKYTLEKNIVMALAKGRKIKAGQENEMPAVQNSDRFENLAYHNTKYFGGDERDDGTFADNIALTAYPDTGIYILSSDRVYLAISAGSNGQKGNGGHAHNDKLSFELAIDGKDVVVDAGTYLYTPLPQRRNQFRSTKSHNTLIVESEEQNVWIDGRYGLFNMKDQSRCYLLGYDKDFVDVVVEYRGIRQRRVFKVEKERVLIENYCNREFSENYNTMLLCSNGYGKLLNLEEGEI